MASEREIEEAAKAISVEVTKHLARTMAGVSPKYLEAFSEVAATAALSAVEHVR